jgi:hypothetical protein
MRRPKKCEKLDWKDERERRGAHTFLVKQKT